MGIRLQQFFFPNEYDSTAKTIEPLSTHIQMGTPLCDKTGFLVVVFLYKYSVNLMIGPLKADSPAGLLHHELSPRNHFSLPLLNNMGFSWGIFALMSETH